MLAGNNFFLRGSSLASLALNTLTNSFLTEPGLLLKGMRIREGLTQKELAEMIGTKTHHISEMEHGKRSIGKAMAHKLAKALGVGYRVFL